MWERWSTVPRGEGGQDCELALADGSKTWQILAGASGDYAHDRRIIGFTEAFEAGGGEVLFVSHPRIPLKECRRQMIS